MFTQGFILLFLRCLALLCANIFCTFIFEFKMPDIIFSLTELWRRCISTSIRLCEVFESGSFDTLSVEDGNFHNWLSLHILNRTIWSKKMQWICKFMNKMHSEAVLTLLNDCSLLFVGECYLPLRSIWGHYGISVF